MKALKRASPNDAVNATERVGAGLTGATGMPTTAAAAVETPPSDSCTSVSPTQLNAKATGEGRVCRGDL